MTVQQKLPRNSEDCQDQSWQIPAEGSQ